MDSFSYQDYILPYSTLKTSSQAFGHGIPEFSLTISLHNVSDVVEQASILVRGTS